MRTGLSTIQQTLTPEAAAVLNRSIAEAARRNHGQTTPLHVAATLLASPTGFLRQACIRSHPNSSHPLQCRALELCFSVALDRLPSATNSNTSSSGSSGLVREPPISNALMAALKRAQAHQRRGCPEQQQQPLLAVKVELEQLVVSILDDPSVSRVMREASFSSPAVKATIEQSMTTTSNSSSSAAASIPPTAAASSPSLSLSTSTAGRLGGLGLRSIPITLIPGNRNMYLNPLLQQQQQKLVEGSGGGAAPAPAPLREEEVKKVLEILQRTKKRNPVLVGDSEPETLLKEVLQRFTRKEGVDGVLRNVQVISLEKEFASDRSQIPQKLKELGNSLETRLRPYDRDSGGGGLILNLGDLKWLVEAPNGSVQSSGSISIQRQQLVSEVGRAAVAEMGKLVVRFVEGGSDRRLWLIGTASCATYLRCQVYHPSMENDWDLQAMPIAPRAPLPSLFPRTAGTGGILSSSVESLAPARGFPPMTATSSPLRRPSDKIDPSRKPMCQSCTESYDRELAKLVEMEFQRSKSSSDSKPEERQPSLLPQWLQAAKLGNGITNHDQTREQDQKWKQSTGDLLKKWTETCSRLHSNPNLLLHQPFEPKPLLLPATKTCSPLRLSDHGGLRPLLGVPERVISPPGSPVRTDLALGSRPMVSDEQNHRDRIAYSGGCAQDFFSKQHPREETGIGNFDPDPFKRLFKGLSETISWQPEAASAVAVTVTQCKSGNGKRRATGAKSDTWLIFVGPDKVGKKKMATALSELVFGPGEGPVTVSLSGASRPDSEDMESSARFRGKLALDRIAEAVRRNPFAVFVLEDVDQADAVMQGSIRRAMENGRLPYSHGREVALGSAIFIMTSNSLPENLRISATDSLIRSEEKLEAAANGKWQLELSIEEKAAKRRPEWLCEGEDERQTKPRKEPRGEISLDLNLAAGVLGEETATGDSSRNSSDVTVEHEHGHDYGRLAVKGRSTSMPKELMDAVDDTIVFKPVDFGPLRRKVSDALSRKFSSVVGGGRTVQVEEEALDRIVGGVWFGGGAAAGLEEWMERVLVPCFRQLKSVKTADDGSLVVKLVTVRDGFPPTRIDGLPIHVTITGCGGCGQ